MKKEHKNTTSALEKFTLHYEFNKPVSREKHAVRKRTQSE